MNSFKNQITFFWAYSRFKPRFRQFLKNASDDCVVALANECIPKLRAIADEGLSQCCEGFDAWTGTAPVILIREALLLTFMRATGLPAPADVELTRWTRKLLKNTDVFIEALQERLRVIGTDASIHAYTAFANVLERAKHGGITVSAPLFIPAEQEADTLVVVFAGMCCFPEFRKSIAELGTTDQLHILDPHRAWYMQDPEGLWRGFEFYTALLEEHIEKISALKKYRRTLGLGNSAGGAAACLFSAHVDRVLAFCPQTRIAPEHIPVEIRDKYAQKIQERIQAALLDGKSIHVHRGISKTDIDQCSRLPAGVELTIHDDFNKHNVPAHLKRKNTLVDTLRAVIHD
jgi:hypothetical protein